jgi:hypothetical protein
MGRFSRGFVKTLTFRERWAEAGAPLSEILPQSMQESLFGLT